MKKKFELKLILPYILLILISSQAIAGGKKKDSGLLLRKNIQATKITEAPRIDGILDDQIWANARVAGGFVQYSPYSGEQSRYKTEVRVLYDNSALYIGAMMYDPRPDSIFKELGERDSDRSLNADNFGIDISPYNDGINGATFKVSVSGVQTDRPPRVSMRGMGMGGGDTWDAVWESRTTVTDEGWIAEIRIPYSALRFPSDKVQTWGLNFWREVKRTREQSSWNYVDREIGTTFNHLGELSDIRDIEPPLRLSLTPYVSGYLEKYNSDPLGASYNGGLDLKYGINESFTLDATLVPDFGQVRSDDQVLNLTPFEVKFNENRPFFMEGTELFNKGGIFYSRRVGSQPKGYYTADDDLDIHEEVSANPSEAGLINATKFSGRTRSGLGIAVFNAMTKGMHATILDTLSDDTREVLTGPFTNFNMLVVDQSMANNSYIALANTNVRRNAIRNENFYTANVTATDFRLQDKSRQYSISGKAAISQKYYDDAETDLGHKIDLRLGKTGGAFRVQYGMQLSNDTYDPNDMGYMRRNNELQNEMSISYNTYNPFWKILTTRSSVQYKYDMLYNPRVFTGSGIEVSSFTTFKNYWTFMLRSEFKPKGSDDYYEPRIDGRFFHRGRTLNFMSWISTNMNKRLSGNMRLSYTKYWSEYDMREFSISFDPKFKFSDRFALGYGFDIKKKFNDIGYATAISDDEVYMGQRDNTTIENKIETSFIFAATSYVSLRLRHYWSRADYINKFYLLQNDGSIVSDTYNENHDYNYNAFTLDMVYTWRFAPGSEMSVVWKNSIYTGSDEIYYDFMDNISYMFGSDKKNSLSLKILYYLDYQSLRKRR